MSSQQSMVPVDQLVRDIQLNVVDIADFNERVVGEYNQGTAEKGTEQADDNDDGDVRSVHDVLLLLTNR